MRLTNLQSTVAEVFRNKSCIILENYSCVHVQPDPGAETLLPVREMGHPQAGVHERGSEYLVPPASRQGIRQLALKPVLRIRAFLIRIRI